MEERSVLGKVKYYAILLGVSVALTCLTLLVPCGADEKKDLSGLQYGLPLPFVEQQSTITPPDDRYPFVVGMESPLEMPTHFRLLSFLIDVIIFSQITVAIRVMMRNRKAQKSGGEASAAVEAYKARRRSKRH